MPNSNIDPYIDYWQRCQVKQKLQEQQLVKQARKSLSEVIKILVEEFNVTKIILFGSLVKGGFSPESDIDLAVEGIPSSKYFQALGTINLSSDRWIDLKPLESLEPYFLKRVLETGECLYDSNFS
jgi:predicted nucleotidyltransferase